MAYKGIVRKLPIYLVSDFAILKQILFPPWVAGMLACPGIARFSPPPAGFNPFEKHLSKWIHLPQIGVKIKHI